MGIEPKFTDLIDQLPHQGLPRTLPLILRLAKRRVKRWHPANGAVERVKLCTGIESACAEFCGERD